MKWFRLAKELHMPVGEAQQRVSSSEFVEWMVYFSEEPNHFNPLFYYLAQIAREIRLSRLLGKKTYSVKDFLLKFTSEKTSQASPEPQMSDQERLKRSKAFWLGGLGIPMPKDK